MQRRLKSRTVPCIAVRFRTHDCKHVDKSPCNIKLIHWQIVTCSDHSQTSVLQARHPHPPNYIRFWRAAEWSRNLESATFRIKLLSDLSVLLKQASWGNAECTKRPGRAQTGICVSGFFTWHPKENSLITWHWNEFQVTPYHFIRPGVRAGLHLVEVFNLLTIGV